MKTINIKGKDYIPVNERIKEFRTNYSNYSLVSEIINLTEDSCIIKATILDENGVVKATGFAQEDRTSSMVNKTSFVENCETSAWGRALGNFGIGIDVSIASAEEVTIAIAKQEKQGGDYIFGSGKYQGKSIKEVYATDENYLNFLMESEKVSRTIKDNIEEFLAEV
jgi:hypothetical protein